MMPSHPIISGRLSPDLGYVSASQLAEALKELKNVTTFLVSFLAMSRDGVPTAEDSSDAVPFSAANETKLLSEYFTVPGAPPDRPFFVAFGDKQGGFSDRKYPGRTLQKQRSDANITGEIFWHPDDKRWAFREGYGDALNGNLRFRIAHVSVSSLAIWFYRTRDLTSITGAVEAFVNEFRLDRDGLIGRNFDLDVQRYSDNDLQAAPLTDEDVARILKVTPPTPAPPPRNVFRKALLDAFVKENVDVSEDLVDAMVVGWLARDIIVLVGAPGTGKSTIARALPSCLEAALGTEDGVVSVSIQITADTDLSTVMGYQNLDGEFVASEFTNTLLLDEENRLKLCVILLDEFNLASIDAYLGPILAAVESQAPVNLMPGNKEKGVSALTARMPIDSFIVATCNSFVDEPETRLPLSRPVKRRSTILNVPNLLEQRVRRDGVPKAFSDVGDIQIAREIRDVKSRLDVGSATAFDRFRFEMLTSCPTYGNLEQSVRLALESVATVFLSESSGRRFFTIGIFKDILISIIMTDPERRIEAIAKQFASKMIHVYSGSIETLFLAAEPLRGQPGFENVIELLESIRDRSEATGYVPSLL